MMTDEEKKKLAKLRRRAKKLDLNIEYDRKTDAFVLIDPYSGTVAAYPALMTLDQIDEWLVDLEKDAENTI